MILDSYPPPLDASFARHGVCRPVVFCNRFCDVSRLPAFPILWHPPSFAQSIKPVSGHDKQIFRRFLMSLSLFLYVPLPSWLCAKAGKRVGTGVWVAAIHRVGDLAGVLVNASLRTEGQNAMLQVHEWAM